MRRGPTFVVALCAAVVELVILAAAGNQWIVDHLIRHETASELPRDKALKATLTSFPWRFTPEGHQRMIWLGQMVADVGMVVVVFLLVWALVGPMRTPRGFAPTFLGTWGLVLGISQVAAIGGTMLAFSDLFDHGRDPDRLGRWWYSVFHGTDAGTVLFGGVSGLIVAIVAGILAKTLGREAVEPDDGLGVSEPTSPWSVGGVGAYGTDAAAETAVEHDWSSPVGAAESGRTPSAAGWPPSGSGERSWSELQRSWSQPVESGSGSAPGEAAEATTPRPSRSGADPSAPAAAGPVGADPTAPGPIGRMPRPAPPPTTAAPRSEERRPEPPDVP